MAAAAINVEIAKYMIAKRNCFEDVADSTIDLTSDSASVGRKSISKNVRYRFAAKPEKEAQAVCFTIVITFRCPW